MDKEIIEILERKKTNRSIDLSSGENSSEDEGPKAKKPATRGRGRGRGRARGRASKK